MNATVTEPIRLEEDPSTVVEIRNGTQIQRKHFCRVEQIQPPLPKPVYSFCKRAFDIVCALLGSLLLFLPMLLIALAIKIDSKGPVFYRQERLGKNGVPFTLLKFRSMRQDAEAGGIPAWAEEHDSRTTKVGRFLRKSRLDELPQLLCILRGTMSFVGPRPERPFFYDEFDKYLDGFRQRMLVVPGLTGLAQVNGGYDLQPEEKILYDLEYIRNRSLGREICILLKTVGVIFHHRGAR